MNLLVTGGAGYIGSHTVKELLDRGHRVCVLDDLSKGHRGAVDSRAQFVWGHTSNAALLTNIFTAHKVDAVIHFAAFIEVGESVTHPRKYYENNVLNTVTLLNCMVDANVLKFVFSSTAAVYGDARVTPIAESAPTLPINPYGRGKLMVETIVKDYVHAYGLNATTLRYFNVCGAAPDASIGEDHFPESHLIPRLLAASLDPDGEARLYGTDYPTADGSCVRDYVHVMDLALAHRLAVEQLDHKPGGTYNLGSEKGFSVKEIIAACARVTGVNLKLTIEARRPGDPATLVANSRAARADLGWQPQFPRLDTMVEHAWRWHLRAPRGFDGLAGGFAP